MKSLKKPFFQVCMGLVLFFCQVAIAQSPVLAINSQDLQSFPTEGSFDFSVRYQFDTASDIWFELKDSNYNVIQQAKATVEAKTFLQVQSFTLDWDVAPGDYHLFTYATPVNGRWSDRIIDGRLDIKIADYALVVNNAPEQIATGSQNVNVQVSFRAPHPVDITVEFFDKDWGWINIAKVSGVSSQRRLNIPFYKPHSNPGRCFWKVQSRPVGGDWTTAYNEEVLETLVSDDRLTIGFHPPIIEGVSGLLEIPVTYSANGNRKLVTQLLDDQNTVIVSSMDVIPAGERAQYEVTFFVDEPLSRSKSASYTYVHKMYTEDGNTLMGEVVRSYAVGAPDSRLSWHNDNPSELDTSGNYTFLYESQTNISREVHTELYTMDWKYVGGGSKILERNVVDIAVPLSIGYVAPGAYHLKAQLRPLGAPWTRSVLDLYTTVLVSDNPDSAVFPVDLFWNFPLNKINKHFGIDLPLPNATVNHLEVKWVSKYPTNGAYAFRTTEQNIVGKKGFSLDLVTGVITTFKDDIISRDDAPQTQTTLAYVAGGNNTEYYEKIAEMVQYAINVENPSEYSEGFPEVKNAREYLQAILATQATVASKKTAINTGTLDTEIQVYPNPATSQIILTLPATTSAVSVIDISGKTVYEASVLEQGAHSIDLEGIAAGIYIARIVSSEITKSMQFVKN